MGLKLFERSKGKIRMTDLGREYLKYVNAAFDTLEEGETRIRELAGQTASQVILSCSINNTLNGITEAYLEAHPAVVIHQSLLPTDNIIRQLERDEIDFAITMRPIEGPDIEWSPIFQSELFVGVSANHPFSNLVSISLSQLRDEPIICNNSGVDSSMLEQLCQAGGFHANIVFETNDGTHIGRMLQKERMLTVIPAWDLYKVSSELSPENRMVHPVRVRDYDARVTVGVARRKSHKLSRQALDLMAFTKQYLLEESAIVDRFAESLFPQEPG